MVPVTGKAPRAAELRYLNQPQPVQVKVDPRGAPRSILVGRQLQPVERVRDRWRVDDTWWREPLCRIYFELELAGGSIVTLFHDRINDQWYRQRYG